MRSLSPLSRRILKKAGIAAAFFCSAFLFGSVLSHFTCRALRKAAPVFLSAAPETPVSSVSMPVLSSAAENWGLSFPEKGKTPVGNATSEELAAYNAWFAASPEENIIYLTFDCGYENGNTPAILDALQKHQAPAAFFVVGNFLSDQPDLVKRMAAEGHIVGNHTWSHPDMSKIYELCDEYGLYMIDETKDDIENIATTIGNVGINSKKKIYDENYDNLRDMATKKANIHKEEVEITTKAIKDGLSDNKMYCKHCGDLIDSDSEFCKHCGKRQ